MDRQTDRGNSMTAAARRVQVSALETDGRPGLSRKEPEIARQKWGLLFKLLSVGEVSQWEPAARLPRWRQRKGWELIFFLRFILFYNII